MGSSERSLSLACLFAMPGGCSVGLGDVFSILGSVDLQLFEFPGVELQILNCLRFAAPAEAAWSLRGLES